MKWNGEQFVIIGAARQGLALARYLVRHGARVALTDSRATKALKEEQAALADLQVEWILGGHPLSLLDGADWLCPSGGVPLEIPLVAEARKRGIPLTNDSQIFLEACKCKVIGITGSAGKTTTTTLVGRMAAEAVKTPKGKYRKAWVGGNIGSPLIADVDEMDKDDLAVMELSSFQLEIMTRSPQVAGILNITPNHLDRHGTMEAYAAAKQRILDFQRAEDTAVLNREDAGSWASAEKVAGRLVSFGRAEPEGNARGAFVRGEAIWVRDEAGEREVMPVAEIKLRGEHNRMNVLAACALAGAAGLPTEAMRKGVQGFTGVAHRLEFVRSVGGADWYNDSIATAPERVIAAMHAFDEPLVLLVGGRDKDLPWRDFARLAEQRVKHMVLFGEAAGLIEKALGGGKRAYTLTVCKTLAEAVQAGARLAEAGDVVLLSPGGTSFDEFKDFEERGERFKEMVMTL